ncbi:zinc ribbon domain-containing protein [Streptomyces sp. LX-29]|uniref:Zn-ribbon domain-containing OB-fold protein n=1 Tax=Streptomyces sp. LX-29 TaxID=2900152 RepID=UPI00240DC28B|nr:zinc ribbon domain-containing protein [Streptomyces sp. LX-29]WFB10904.1 zinc ribbon domain-containing protein [Streptomyces sp. LX-29]
MFHTVAEITELAPAPAVRLAPDAPPVLEATADAPVAPPADGGWPGQVYLDGLRRGELYFQRCRWCRTACFHRLLCPICASTDLTWEHSAGTGAVRHTSVVRRRTGSLRTVATIDMAEGFRLRATLAGVFPDTVRPGTLVRLDAEGLLPQAEPGELVFRMAA